MQARPLDAPAFLCLEALPTRGCRPESGLEDLDAVVAKVVDVDVAGGINDDAHRLDELAMRASSGAPASEVTSGARIELTDPVAADIGHVENAAVRRERHVERQDESPPRCRCADGGDQPARRAEYVNDTLVDRRRVDGPGARIRGDAVAAVVRRRVVLHRATCDWEPRQLVTGLGEHLEATVGTVRDVDIVRRTADEDATGVEELAGRARDARPGHHLTAELRVRTHRAG